MRSDDVREMTSKVYLLTMRCSTFRCSMPASSVERRSSPRSKRQFAALKNIRVLLENTIETDTEAFAEGVFCADHIGIHPMVDGTPIRLDFRFVAAVTAADGKIVRWAEYFDTKPLKPRERTHLYPISRRSAYWEGTAKAGVSEFMVYNHTYMPLIYHHSPAEEYVALTERVTLWDVGGERQTQIRGPDAIRFARLLTTRDLSKLKVGDCKYTLVCDPQGMILCDPVLLYPWENVIWLSHGDVDLTLWAAGIGINSGLQVEIDEPDVQPVQVQGPQSLAMLRSIVESPLDSLGFYKCVVTKVAGIDAVVSRTGWSGGAWIRNIPAVERARNAALGCPPRGRSSPWADGHGTQCISRR